jgi:hypothetical protein
MRIVALMLLFAALLVPAPARAADDILDNYKSRMKVEAERVEKEYKDGRLAAYKLVSRDDPKLLDATEKLTTLLAMVQKDRSLSAERRKVIIVTLKWDMDKVAEIAAQRRKSAARDTERIAARDRGAETAKASTARRTEETRSTTDVARSILESRGRTVADARKDRVTKGDSHNRVMASVDKAAVPDSRNYVMPSAAKWKEITEKRSKAIKMTAAEKAIMKALESSLDVDYSKATFEEVLDQLRKKLKVTITADKKALEEASVTYESEINLKLRASTRTVLKRLLSDLGLTYVIKDEAIQITTPERAKEMTTTRTYYLGDLAAVVDLRLDPFTRQALMMQQVNNIISMITTQVDRQSWKVNNPEAPGVIVFDPITFSLVVKQTAEMHFLLGSK